MSVFVRNKFWEKYHANISGKEASWDFEPDEGGHEGPECPGGAPTPWARHLVVWATPASFWPLLSPRPSYKGKPFIPKGEAHPWYVTPPPPRSSFRASDWSCSPPRGVGFLCHLHHHRHQHQLHQPWASSPSPCVSSSPAGMWGGWGLDEIDLVIDICIEIWGDCSCRHLSLCVDALCYS